MSPELVSESVQLDEVELDLDSLDVSVRRVTMRCLVDVEGNVVDAKVHRLLPPIDPDLATERDFIEAAIEKSAMKYWRFRPAQKNGTPVSVWHTVTLNFSSS